MNSTGASTFFQAGGSLPQNFPTYVERHADKDLIDHLDSGDFCYILTSRQMGKSSLKVRAIQTLAKRNWICFDIDVSSIGSRGITVEQWYYSFLYEIVMGLRLEDEFDDWWDENDKLSPISKMSLFWEQFLLVNTDQEIVIFIDEVDSMLILEQSEFSTDDFFAAIRSIYNRRANQAELKRLHFCIIGVARPDDLLSDPMRTPFNVGKSIKLENFQFSEAQALCLGLQKLPYPPELLLKEIIKWTKGHPYLTQRLCVEIQRNFNPDLSIEQLVEQHVMEIFLAQGALNNEPNLTDTQRRIIENKEWNTRMLSVYQRILTNDGTPVVANQPEQIYLRLSGLVREDLNSLIINNPIYKSIFNNAWLESAWGKVERPLSGDIQRWIANDRHSDFLLRGQALILGENWAEGREDLSLEEQNFIYQSREEEQSQEFKSRRVRILRNFSIAVGIVAFIAVALGIWANSLRLNENRLNEELRDMLFESYMSRGQQMIENGQYDSAKVTMQQALPIVENEVERDSVSGLIRRLENFKQLIAFGDSNEAKMSYIQAFKNYEEAESLDIHPMFVQRKIDQLVEKGYEYYINYARGAKATNRIELAKLSLLRADSLKPGDSYVQKQILNLNE